MACVPQFSKAAFADGAGITLDSFVQAAQRGSPAFVADRRGAMTFRLAVLGAIARITSQNDALVANAI
jgi:hypothetical protein